MTNDQPQQPADACPTCKGAKQVPRYQPGGLIDPGEDSPLGSAKLRTCPTCNGTGKRP